MIEKIETIVEPSVYDAIAALARQLNSINFKPLVAYIKAPAKSKLAVMRMKRLYANKRHIVKRRNQLIVSSGDLCWVNLNLNGTV